MDNKKMREVSEYGLSSGHSACRQLVIVHILNVFICIQCVYVCVCVCVCVCACTCLGSVGCR